MLPLEFWSIFQWAAAKATSLPGEHFHNFILLNLQGVNAKLASLPHHAMSLYLSPLSNRLACCVTRLWPQAGFKDNHVDREATRRHCHPLCPLPVAAPAVDFSPLLSVVSLCLSSLCHCSDTPSYLCRLLRGKKKKRKRPPKIEKHMHECTQTHAFRQTCTHHNIRIHEWVHTHTHTEGRHYHDTPGTRVSVWLTLWWMTVGRIVGHGSRCDVTDGTGAERCTKGKQQHQCAHFHLYACIMCNLG